MQRENHIKKLIYQSWYRGCKETDRIIGTYAKKFLPSMNNEDIKLFETLLDEADSNLFNWITGKEEIPARLQDNRILADICKFKSYNEYDDYR